MLAINDSHPLTASDPDTHTVRVKVTKVEEKKVGKEWKEGTATLEVIRVYSGPKDLNGQIFTDTFQTFGDRTGRSSLVPFEVNEEGIWTICKGKPVDGGKPLWVVCGRVRKKDNARFEQWEEVFELMEKVNAEKPEKRFPLLRELVNHKTTEVACWAVSVIGDIDSSETGAYLNAVAAKPDPKLPVQVQIALDVVLCKRKESDWLDSKSRAEMLRGWVSGKQDQHDAGRILSRLYNTQQDHNLADKLAVELWRTAAENKEWPLDTRKYAIWRMDFVVKFSASDEARFAAIDWVYEQMRSNDTIELRRAAAGTLSQLPVYPKRLKAIEEHLATEKDEKVAEALRAAIKKAKEDDK